jgi:hypothetical protein
LRQQYYFAGIPEYWLINARGDDVDFQILARGADDYVAVVPDTTGYLLISARYPVKLAKLA